MDACATIAAPRARRRASRRRGGDGRILVIQLGRLGDVIQTTPLLEVLRRRHPHAQIDLLVFDNVADALEGIRAVRVRAVRESAFPDGIREADRRIESDRRAHRSEPAPELARLFEELALPDYELLLNCSYSPLAAWIARQAHCRSRTGARITANDEVLFEHPAHIYTVARAQFRRENWFNLVDLWRATGGPAEPPSAGARPTMPVAKSAPFQFPSGPLVALNPGSSERNRQWPAPNFAVLARELSAHGFRPVLVGAPSDVPICAAVEAQCSTPVTNLCGQTSVPEMAWVLSRMRLLISNDTGAIHIASAVGCRVLGLFGASAYFAETAPWSEGNVILQGPLKQDGVCLPPELVAGAALVCMKDADEGELSRQLGAAGAAGWCTYFLPRHADPWAAWPTARYIRGRRERTPGSREFSATCSRQNFVKRHRVRSHGGASPARTRREGRSKVSKIAICFGKSRHSSKSSREWRIPRRVAAS